VTSTPGLDPESGSGRSTIKVAIVNDFEVIAHGLAAMLAPWRHRVEIVELEVGGAPDCPADVALLDTFGQSDRVAIRVEEIVQGSAARHVAIYTFDFDPMRIAEAERLGVSGYLSKGTPAEQLADDLVAVAAGRRVVHQASFRRPSPVGRRWPGQEHGLSEREAEVLSLVSRGLTNRAVAHAMHLSEDTVKTHLKSVYRKLGIRNRASATRFAIRSGISID